MMNVESYRRYAADCVRQAQGEETPEDRNILLNVALAWLRLAKQTEAIDAGAADGADPTRLRLPTTAREPGRRSPSRAASLLVAPSGRTAVAALPPAGIPPDRALSVRGARPRRTRPRGDLPHDAARRQRAA